MDYIKKLLERIKEPSSLAAITTVALALGISQPVFETWMQAILGVLALAAFLMPEKGPPPAP